MPLFCRHNRFEASCPICGGKEQQRRAATAGPRPPAQRRSGGSGRSARGGVRVRHVERAADDGFYDVLVPGLRSSLDARRLADEIALASAWLTALAVEPPPGLAEIASEPDIEEALWLAFLTAYMSPLESDEPFSAIEAIRVPWRDGGGPDATALAEAPVGPRGAHDPARGTATLDAYRAWAQRAGSQQQAFVGELSWAPQRRFQRAFERLSLPGLTRSARFDLLLIVARCGRVEMAPDALHLGGADPTTASAKRVFGIGDVLLLERRAADLAEAGDVPLETLDLALWNWGGEAPRSTMGMPGLVPDPDVAARLAAGLGLAG